MAAECHCRVPLLGAIVACFGGDGGPTLADWTAPECHCRVPLLGAIVACFGGDGGPTLADWTAHQNAIAGCHCWVPLWRALAVMVGQLWRIGRGTRMPLQGAIAGCHCGVLWWIVACFGGDGGPTLADWTWYQCRCTVPLSCALVGRGRGTRVPLWRALVGMVCQLWQTRVPLQGAIAMCYGGGRCESGETAWS